MVIVWDEHKRLLNIEKHGYDFAALDKDFLERFLVVETRGNRILAVGRFRDNIVAVVFSLLGTEAVSIISMRAASKIERAHI